MQIVFFLKKSFYICISFKTNVQKQQKNKVMKKSDLVIIAVGIVIIAAIFAGIVYAAITLNNGNAGFHGGF